jgi:short-subunit dehydrogenase
MMPGTRPSALITGASSGIGSAAARDLAQRGYRLGLIGRDAARLAAVAERCAELNGGDCSHGVCDIRDGAAFGRFLDSFGDVDLYFSNAGILDGRRAEEAIESRESALDVLSVNLTAGIDCLHRVLGGMRERGSGRIVLVSSLAGLSPLADAPAYSASKAGLIAYGLALREALRGEGIGVTVACPGYVETPMAREHHGHRPHQISAEDAAARIIRAALKGRALCGFPFPLYPAAHLSAMIPPWLNRLFTQGLRFTVVPVPRPSAPSGDRDRPAAADKRRR